MSAKMPIKSPLVLLILVAFFCLQPSAATLPKCFARIQNPDSVCLVWVVFNDKPIPSLGLPVSPHALARRAKARFKDNNFSDAPVANSYINTVARHGARCRNIFNWANAASFSAAAKNLKAIAALPQVKAILPVRSFTQPHQSAPALRPLQKESAAADPYYGVGFTQLNQINVPLAHHFIATTLSRAPGRQDSAIIIGVLDGGFWLTHRCFDFMHAAHAILADSDF
ncbi:MAG: hypothetical protein PHC61_18795, partial [Chitinivibrionales bacterium]|nr:hypothetical protein [Chitinivibrionales bacterium]